MYLVHSSISFCCSTHPLPLFNTTWSKMTGSSTGIEVYEVSTAWKATPVKIPQPNMKDQIHCGEREHKQTGSQSCWWKKNWYLYDFKMYFRSVCTLTSGICLYLVCLSEVCHVLDCFIQEFDGVLVLLNYVPIFIDSCLLLLNCFIQSLNDYFLLVHSCHSFLQSSCGVVVLSNDLSLVSIDLSLFNEELFLPSNDLNLLSNGISLFFVDSLAFPQVDHKIVCCVCVESHNSQNQCQQKIPSKFCHVQKSVKQISMVRNISADFVCQTTWTKRFTSAHSQWVVCLTFACHSYQQKQLPPSSQVLAPNDFRSGSFLMKGTGKTLSTIEPSQIIHTFLWAQEVNQFTLVKSPCGLAPVGTDCGESFLNNRTFLNFDQPFE